VTVANSCPMQFVGNCFFGHRTGQQMFADGYTYGGGGGS